MRCMMCRMKRRKNVYSMPFILIGFLVCGLVLWHIIWTIAQQRNLPIHFDVSLLQDFKYVTQISKEDRLEPLSRYGYNVVISHDIGPTRSIPDTSHKNCKLISSSTKHELPSTSVVIVFTDVDRSVLLRNVVSVLTKSGPVTILEIILIDDGSENHKDGQLLTELPGIKIIRNERRKGRGLARMQGAAVASGDIIVFLDSLAEVNINWLPPLVLRLAQFPRDIVSPVIDVISHETFEYTSLPGLFRGAFDWSLQYHWEEVPTRHHSYDDPTEPHRSPALKGNVFAIKRQFFNTLGGYDQNPAARETEDLEFSLRSWMCGGQIEIVPCSRVGIIQANGRELGKPEISFNKYIKSARRVAEIWMDEYKRFFYSTRPTARMQVLSDFSSQRKLKERLKCKSFKWFLTSVYTQLQPLINDEVAYGYIRQETDCIDVDPGQLPLIAKLRECEENKISQEWSWRKRGVIVSNGMCLTADLMKMQGYVTVQFCKDIDTQIWYRHNEKIVHQDTNLCLDGHQGNTGLMIMDCIKDEASQVWYIQKEMKDKYPEDHYVDHLGML